MSHDVYPVDSEEEEQKSYESMIEDSSSEDETSSVDLKQKKNEMGQMAKLKIFINIAPQDFLDIKKQFSFYENVVNLTQFCLIFMDVIRKTKTITQEYYPYLEGLIELFSLIDVYQQNKITFDQFSNFLVEMHEILSRDQNLYELKLKQKELTYQNNPLERLFDLNGYHGFAYLEANLKQLRLVNPKNWEEIVNISIGSTTIVSAYFIKNTLLISSNDKFLNFFDLKTHKLLRRFMVPDVQTYIQHKKSTIYTGAVNGTIYCWDLDRIFTKDFLKAMNKHPDCFKLVIKNVPIQEQEDMSCMISIESLEIIATGSNDTYIRLYENKRKLSSNNKKLKGHSKGIKALQYCSQYKYLVSCSYDFDVLVWNIYLDHPLAKLVGHEAPLITILTIQEKKPNKFTLLLSCDAKGVLRVWDPKTFQTVQTITIGGTVDQRVKSIIYKKEVNLVILGFKQIQLLEMDRSFDPNISEDQPIQTFCLSQKYLELHVATSRHIKTWDISKGVLKRIFKYIVPKDIISLTLDSTEKRMFIGTHLGSVYMVDIFTGFLLREIPCASKEICFLQYSQTYNLIVTVSCDEQIRILKDVNQTEKKQEKDLTLRTVKNAHPQEIVTAAFSQSLMLIATTTRDTDLRLWDFEKGNFISKLPCNPEITFLLFLDPYPLLLACDSFGTIVIYFTRPHIKESQIAIIWKNMFTIMKAAIVNSVVKLDDSIIIGDENGDVRIIDLQQMIQQLKIKPIDAKEFAQNRNPLRFFQLVFQEYEQKNEKLAAQGLVSEKLASQIQYWKAHKFSIKCMALLDNQILITLGNERIVKIWTLKGKEIGQLRQGVSFDGQGYQFYREVQNKDFEKVMKEWKEENRIKDKLKRAKQIPFKKEEEEIVLGHVESKEIFKNLQEISRYLDRDK